MSFQCKLDAAAFAACASPKAYTVAAGSHTFQVQASDGSKTSSATSFAWTVDQTAPPAPSISAHPTDPTTSTSASFSFSDSESGVSFLCKLDGGAFTACSSPQGYSGMSTTAHSFAVEAKDAAGNIGSPTSFSWTVTAPPPPAPSITAHPANLTNQTSASFSFTDSQAGVSYVCALDSNLYTACASPQSYAGPLGSGSHSFSVEAKSGSAVSSPTSFAWTVDTSPPSVVVSFPTSGGAYGAAGWNAGCSGGAGICGTATDSNGVASGAVSILQVATGKYWNGSSFSSASEVFNNVPPTGLTGTTFSGRYPLAVPPTGAYTLHARAVDNAGNTSSTVTVNFSIDTTPPPAPTITANPPSTTSSSSASFGFTDSEAGVTFLCKLDGGAYSACTSPKAYSGLAAGSHSFSVEAVDTAGNVSTATSYSWTIGPPPAPSITAQPANPSNLTTASFSFSDSEPTATFLCSLDGSSFAACTSPKSYTGLAAGSHTFKVEASSGSATSAATSYTWTIDLTPPPAPSITAKPANPSNQPSPSFSLSDSEAGVGFLCKLDGGAFTACSSPQGYGPLAQGSHTFSVEAKDTAGNVSGATSYTWLIDTTPPPAPSLSATPTNPSYTGDATFAFGDSEAGVAFSCQVDVGVYAPCTSPKSYGGLASGSHTFYVIATDAAGNTSTPTTYGWTVDTSPPPAPTVTPNQTNPTNSTAIAFTLTDTRPGVTYTCSLDGSSFAACTSPKSYTGLAAGSHTFQAKALTGTNASAVTSYSWTIDLTAPTASSINRADASPTNTGPLHWTVTFSEPVLNVGAANFALVTSGLAGTAPTITSVTPAAGPWATWTVTASTTGTTASNGSIGLNLTSKGTIKDSAGNLLGGSVPVVGQAYTYDTTAPGTPTITSGPPLLPNWTTTTNASFAFTGDSGVTFLCSLNSTAPGDFSACSSAKSYSGVPQGTNTFYVKAKDAAGNLSAAASRQWQVDTVNPPTPVFTLVPPNPNSTATSNFDWTPHLPSGDINHYECSKENGSFVTCGPPPYTYAVGTTNNGEHQFSVRAVDNAGNVGQSISYSWKVAAGTAQNYTISGTATSLLYPTTALTGSPINLTFNNPNAGNGGSGVNGVQVSNLTVAVASVTAPNATVSRPCGTIDFAVTQFSGSYPFYIPQGTSSLSTLSPAIPSSQWPTIRLINRPVNQDGCKGATVNLTYTGTP